MRPFACVLLSFLLSLAPVSLWAADDADSNLPRGAELVGVAHSEGTDQPLDQQMRGELDSLVPRLRQLPADSPILIEAHVPAQKGRGKEDRIKRAYALAEQAQQYLSSRHKLHFEYYISVWENGEANSADRPKVRFSTYPLDFFDN